MFGVVIMLQPSSETVDKAVRNVAARIAARYDVATALLYGSRARGDNRPDSDADLAVILNGPKRSLSPILTDFAEIEFDTLLETGVIVAPMPIWREDWERPDGFSNPYLLAAIRHDGIVV